MTVGDLSRRTSLRVQRRNLVKLSALSESCAWRYNATIVNHDGSFAVAARIAFFVYGFEAFERRFVDAPDLHGRRLGRVATRGRRQVCCRCGRHPDVRDDEQEAGGGGVTTYRDVCSGGIRRRQHRICCGVLHCVVTANVLRRGFTSAPSPRSKHHPQKGNIHSRHVGRGKHTATMLTDIWVLEEGLIRIPSCGFNRLLHLNTALTSGC